MPSRHRRTVCQEPDSVRYLTQAAARPAGASCGQRCAALLGPVLERALHQDLPTGQGAALAGVLELLESKFRRLLAPSHAYHVAQEGQRGALRRIATDELAAGFMPQLEKHAS